MDDNDPTQLVIPLSEGKSVILRGIIDRIDIADIDGQKAALIFDYKRRETSVAWDKLSNGLDLQLGVYMIAARNILIDGQKPDIAVGAFYLPVESSTARKGDKFSRKAKGIFNGELYEGLNTNAPGGWNEFYNFFIGKDAAPYGHYGNSGALRPEEFDNLLEFVKSKIISHAEKILSGQIDILPYRSSGQVPCDFCDFKKLCRFDIHFNDYNELQPTKKDALINSLGDDHV
jgi:ATP-dependent helicase/nuclease subunit B